MGLDFLGGGRKVLGELRDIGFSKVSEGEGTKDDGSVEENGGPPSGNKYCSIKVCLTVLM